MDALSAFHEGGHAAVSLLLGEFPETVSIRAEGDSLGHTAYLGVEAQSIAQAAIRGRTKADRDRVMAYLVGLAAGPAAQALHMRRGVRVNFLDQGTWETFGGSKDFEQLQFFVAGKARGLEDVTADDVVSEAFDLLEQPKVWASVERVAAELLRFNELGYDDLRLII